MLPPPPKRTRAVAPESGTTSETSNVLPPPPSSRDRRNRRTATNTQTASFPTANPFLPQPSLFTPLTPFTPFIPTSPEDDTPDSEPSAILETDSTPQTEEAIVSSPVAVNGTSHLLDHSSEVKHADDSDNMRAIEESQSDESQKEQFLESEVFPSPPTSDASATTHDMIADGWRDEDPESASFNPEPSQHEAPDGTIISSGWGDDPETVGEVSTFEPDTTHFEEPVETHQPSEESTTVEETPEQVEDTVSPVNDAEVPSQGAHWNEDDHETTLEEAVPVSAPSETLDQEANLLSPPGQTTAAEFDDWGHDEDDLAPLDTSMETHAAQHDQAEMIDANSHPDEASSFPLAPTDSAFGDWGEDPEESLPTTSLSTTQDQEDFDLSSAQDHPAALTEPHSEELLESVEQAAPLTDTSMVAQDSISQETPIVTTTTIEPSSEPIDFGFGDELSPNNEQVSQEPQEEPLVEETDQVASSAAISGPGLVEFADETEIDHSSHIVPQSQDFGGDWDESGWGADSPSVPSAELQSDSNLHEETGSDAYRVEELHTEAHYDDEFCEIDSTSRSVLASLNPVDSTMHPIMEAADETSSTASEMTPRQVSLGLSNPTLPSIPENSSSSFDHEEGETKPNESLDEGSEVLFSSNPEIPIVTEENLLLDDSTQLHHVPIHVEPVSGDLFLDSSSEHQDEPASFSPEHPTEETVVDQDDKAQTGDDAAGTGSEQLFSDSTSALPSTLSAAALPSSSHEDLVFDDSTQLQFVDDEPEASISDEPLFEDSPLHEPIATDIPIEGDLEPENTSKGIQTVHVEVSDEPLFDDSLSLNAAPSVPSSSQEHIHFDGHVQSNPVSYEEANPGDIEFEAAVSVSIEVTEPEDAVTSALVEEELLGEASSLNGSVSISEDPVLDNEDESPQTPSFVDEPLDDLVIETSFTQIIEGQEVHIESVSHLVSSSPSTSTALSSEFLDTHDTNDTTTHEEVETSAQDKIPATSSEPVSAADAPIEDQLDGEAALDTMVGQETSQDQVEEDSSYAPTAPFEVDATQESQHQADIETDETQNVDAVVHEDVIEDEIVYSELEPAEAESMFNQYKQSLKEHQDTLKQLLDEREVMRLELQTVMLHYGPMHELQERLASLKLEYDELSQVEGADETVASELTDLADTIYHYETAIQRRQEEPESQKSPRVGQSTSTEQHSAHIEVFNDAQLPVSSNEPDALPYVPETSTQFMEDIEDLKLRLKQRDEEIEAQLLQITHLKVHVSTLEESLTKLKESESESELVQVELRREVEEAQKVIDRLLQQESLVTQYADTIAKLEQELSQVKEDAQKQAEAAVTSSHDLEVESFVFDGSEPIETVNAKISELLLQKAQSIVEVQQLKVEVTRLVEKLTSTERRMSIEVSALDSQLVERETENSILREKLSAATVTEMSPEVQIEMTKLQKGYELTKSHLTKCEKELEEAVSRANELDQLWKTECQLRTELQLQHQAQKHHPHNRAGSNPSSPFKMANGSDKSEQAKLKEQAKALLDAEYKIAELETLLSDRDERSTSLEKEIERLRRTMEGLEAKGHESARSASKQAAIIDGLRQQLNSLEVEAASKTFDHEAALNEDLAMKNLRIEELEIELKALVQSNEALTSEISSLKSTLSKLDQRYQELKHQQQTSDKDEIIAELRAENKSLLEQLNSVTGEKNVHVSELQSELESVQRALEAVQTDMFNSSKKTETTQTASPRNSNDVAIIDELTTELQMLKAQLDQSTQSFETSQDRINELESTVSSSQREQEHARSQLSKALSDATQEKARVKDLSAQVNDKVQLVKDLEMELEAASAAHITSVSRIHDLESIVANQKAEIADIEAELDRQQAELTDLHSTKSSLLSTVNASSERIQDLERSLQEANSKLQETLVALAKSEAEYSSLVSELEMTRIELREAQEARDSAIESAAKATPEHNEEDISTIASLKAELARKDSLMYEAYAAFEGEMGYMAQEMESQWKEKLEKATAALSKAAVPDPSESEALEKRIIQLEEELEKARLAAANALQDGETEKQVLRSQFAADMSSLREERELLANQLQNAQAASSEAELKHLEEMDALALQVASMEEKLASTTSQFTNAQLQLASKSSEESNATKSEIAALQDQVASLNEIVAQSERTIEKYANDLDSLKQAHELALEKAGQATELEAVKSSHQQLLQDYASLESQHAALLESQQATETELERLLSQSSEQASSASEYASKLQELENRLQIAHEERLKLMKQREEERQAEKDTMHAETSALSAEVTRLTQLAQQRNEAMLESSVASAKVQEELAAAHSQNKDLESELTLMSSKVDSLAQDLDEYRSQVNTLRAENTELLAAADEAKQRSTNSSDSPPLVFNASTAPVQTTSAPLDDWGNDDGWDTSSPVEQQAELEYLRSFLKSKSKEVDDLKLQLAQATQTKPVPAVENLRPSSSLPTSPYVAPARVSSPSLAPIHLEPSDAKDLFGDDGGWDDLEFEPLPVTSAKPEPTPVVGFDSSVHEEEIRELKAQLDHLKATEKQNESLKAALALRDGELEEGAEQYQELKNTLEGLQSQVMQLETNLKAKEDELSELASSAAAAVPVSLPPAQTIRSSAEIQSIQAELDKANQTIKTLQSMLASKPAAAHIATTSLDFGSDEFDGDGWDNFGEEVDKKQASQVNSLERELETLRHISDQKDGNLSSLRVEIASLKATIAELEAKATEPKEGQNADLFESAEDVSSRISQAVEHERSQWKAEIQKVEDAYEQQIQNLELKHLTELEQAELAAQETLRSKIDSAVVAAKSDNDSSLHKRLRDAEEIHQTQKDLLETQLAKLSADHQALDLKNNQLSSQLTTVLEQNKSLTLTVTQLQSQISELTSNASQLVTLKEQNEQLRLQCEELRSTQLGDNQSLADELESLRSAREAAETSNMALKESYQLQLEEAQASRLDIETKLALNEQKLHEVQSALEALRAESRTKQELIHQKEMKIMDLQSRMNSEKQSQENTLLTAEEDAMTLRDENVRLKQQLDQTKKSVQALNVAKVEQENLIDSLKQQESRSAAQIKTYLARLEQLQALIDKPTASASTWAEEQLLTQTAIAERLTTENAKLSKGLVSGLMDSQTPIERLAASKAQLQDRVDRLEKDLKRIKTELSARTEERDALRTKVDTLSSERQDLKRQISASPAARYSSPAAHFASYAATPSSPFAPSIPYPVASAPQSGAAYPIASGSTAI